MRLFATIGTIGAFAVPFGVGWLCHFSYQTDWIAGLILSARPINLSHYSLVDTTIIKPVQRSELGSRLLLRVSLWRRQQMTIPQYNIGMLS